MHTPNSFNMTSNAIFTLVLFSIIVCKVHSYSSGAPEQVCTSMAPNRRSHGALPKSNSRNVDKFGFAGPVQLDLVFFDRFVLTILYNVIEFLYISKVNILFSFV